MRITLGKNSIKLTRIGLGQQYARLNSIYRKPGYFYAVGTLFTFMLILIYNLPLAFSVPSLLCSLKPFYPPSGNQVKSKKYIFCSLIYGCEKNDSFETWRQANDLQNVSKF